jgi:hypothetical protein
MATAEQLDAVHCYISGYLWWTAPDGYKLSRSRGRSMTGRGVRYTLTCPYPNERTGSERTYKHKRFYSDAEAIDWAKQLVGRELA